MAKIVEIVVDDGELIQGVLENLDYDELASKLAQSEYLPVPSAEVIADSIDVVEVANFLKPDDVAAHIDMKELAKKVADIDDDYLREEVVELRKRVETLEKELKSAVKVLENLKSVASLVGKIRLLGK